ncbi:MAG: hypothetical protein QNJ51_18465 [Calothrix sp. MO_167.B12]|nr:hypothetical protein [Calothrix sp. MO_167.B12]
MNKEIRSFYNFLFMSDRDYNFFHPHFATKNPGLTTRVDGRSPNDDEIYD